MKEKTVRDRSIARAWQVRIKSQLTTRLSGRLSPRKLSLSDPLRLNFSAVVILKIALKRQAKKNRQARNCTGKIYPASRVSNHYTRYIRGSRGSKRQIHRQQPTKRCCLNRGPQHRQIRQSQNLYKELRKKTMRIRHMTLRMTVIVTL